MAWAYNILILSHSGGPGWYSEKLIQFERVKIEYKSLIMLNVLNIMLMNKHSMLFTSCVKNSEKLIQFERVKIESHKN